MKYRKTHIDFIRERDEIPLDHECPNCGWDALKEEGLKEGCCEVIHDQKTDTDFGPGFELHIKCTCPMCNTEFEYFDGSP